MVVTMYTVMDSYKKLGKLAWLRHIRRILMHQEWELSEKESYEKKGVCLLCGCEKPRKEEWR